MAGALPVILPVWRRPELFPGTLEWLARQESVSPHLYVFNNNWDARDRLERFAGESPVPVSFIHSHENVGSIARFEWARKLYLDHPYLVFIDDDQRFEPHALAGLLEEAAPRSIVGVWAWRINSMVSYWEREKAPPGGEADYVGTGGQIIDSSIFGEEEVYKVPKPYAPVEDLWLCHQARRRGWALSRSLKVHWTPPDADELDQWRVLRREKDMLYRFVVRDGFRPLKFMGKEGRAQSPDVRSPRGATADPWDSTIVTGLLGEESGCGVSGSDRRRHGRRSRGAQEQLDDRPGESP